MTKSMKIVACLMYGIATLFLLFLGFVLDSPVVGFNIPTIVAIVMTYAVTTLFVCFTAIFDVIFDGES